MTMHELVDRIRNEIPIWWAASEDEGYEVKVISIDDEIDNIIIYIPTDDSFRAVSLKGLM